MKRQKIKLDDVHWAYDVNGTFVIPFVYNTENTKIKDITTNTIFDSDGKNLNANPIPIYRVFARMNNVDPNDVRIDNSTTMLTTYGTSLIAAHSSIVLNRLHRNIYNNDECVSIYRCTEVFCKDNKATLAEYARMAIVLKREIIKENKKKEKEENKKEDENDFFKF